MLQDSIIICHVGGVGGVGVGVGDGGVYTHACVCAFNLCCCIKVLVHCLF